MKNIITFRDPDTSLIQSALGELLDTKNQTTGLSREDVMRQFSEVLDAKSNSQPIPPLDSNGSGFHTCVSLGAQLAFATVTGDAATAARLKSEMDFSTCDPLWSDCVTRYLEFKASQGTIGYITHRSLGDFVIDLPQKAPLKIGILGDWGAGTSVARNVALELSALQPDVFIHLGDVYYTCTPAEAQKNFLSALPAAWYNGSRFLIPVYSLCGNHDMYSGGAGYYGLLKTLSQPASYFCLRNDHWQLLAMDTGRNDSNPLTVDSNVTSLMSTEVEWHLDKIANAGTRRTILLSHHQLFSSTDSIGTENGNPSALNAQLFSAFKTPLEKGAIDLWLWGHEHNLLVYDSYAGLPAGRCIGASAIPVLVSDNPYHQVFPQPALSGIQHRLPDDGTNYGHSFALMKLDDLGASIEYYATHPDGSHATLLFSESF
jgi:hypothetical protein